MPQKIIRVWESNLVTAIAECGIKYTILDDTHFRMAGLREQGLFGYYVTEDQGQTLKLVPSSMKVRYLVPFAEPKETIEYFSRCIHIISRKMKFKLIKSN